MQSKLVTHGSEAWTVRPRGHRASTGHPGRFWPFLARNGQKTTRNGQKRPVTPASDAPSGPPALPTCVSPHRLPLVAVRGGHTANWWRLLLARAVPVIDLSEMRNTANNIGKDCLEQSMVHLECGTPYEMLPELARQSEYFESDGVKGENLI